MSLIDPDLAAVLDSYRTCEFATLGSAGTPLTGPTVAQSRPDGTLLVTTSTAFPQRALNVRRDGRVALLFSDPAGSGQPDAPQVFISGKAYCPYEIVTSPTGLEGYWTRLFERHPISKRYTATPLNQVTDWYFMRLLITIEPDSVVIRDPITSIAAAPGTGLPDGAAPLGAEILARFPTAVLGALDPAGAPLLMRTTTTPVEEGFEVRTEKDSDVAAGPATLLVYPPDQRLSGPYSAVVRGRLSELGAGRWLLIPDRVTGPSATDSPTDPALLLLKENQRAATRYLDRRGLARPRVPWDEYRKLAAGA